MNTCINEETLSAYCDGVLDAVEQTSVEQHLQNCWLCRRVESDFRALSSGIQNLPELQPPAEFRRNLVAKLKAESRPQRLGQRFNNKWLKTAAAAVLILVLAAPGYILYFNSSSLGDNSAAPTAQQAAENRLFSSSEMESAARQDSTRSGGTSTQNGQQGSLPKADTFAASGSVSLQAVDRIASVELYVSDLAKSGQTVLRQALDFPDIRVKSFVSYDNSVVLVLDVSGQRTQSFLTRLNSFGEVGTVNSRGNIAGQTGSMELIINISSP